jgi:hypothetical protein
MHDYSTPQLTRFGDFTELTGFFGPSAMDDVAMDESGNDVSEDDDTGSIDACAQVDGVCLS